MKILCDADVDGPLVQHLRDSGHEVAYIAELEGRPSDDEVLERARQQDALLITRDKGFGQLVFQQGLTSKGVLLIRLAGIPMGNRKTLLARAIEEHGEELIGAFSVLTRSRLRIRRRIVDPSNGPS